MKSRIKCSLISVVLSGMAATALAQSNIYVATNGDDAANSGQSWASPYATISNGIAKAPTAGDTVWVSNGAYVLSAQLSIANAITVSAWSANASNTIIDGNGAVRCVSISAAATLNGFTLTNGYVLNGYGGGVNMTGGGTVTGCVIVNNTVYTNISDGYNAHGGGGVYMTGGTKLKNCEIRNNRAWDCAGGGVCNRGATVTDCTIEGNIATNGGGVYLRYGVVQGCTIRANQANDAQLSGFDGGGGVLVMLGEYVIDCLIEKNTNTATSASEGGGVFLYATGLMTNCIIRQNRGGLGAGVSMRGSTAPYARVFDCQIISNVAVGTSRGGGVVINSYGVLERCTIMGNNCSDRGAGVFADRGGQIRNCLFVGNSNSTAYGGGVMLAAIQTYGGYMSACTIVSNYAASGRGAGIDMNDWDYGTTPTNGITNCVAYFNWGGGNIYPATAVLLSNVWYSGSTVALPANQGNITPSDPLFVDRTAGNYRLTKDSPCVNAGTNESWMANSIDRDMRMRIRYGRVDMGAYEVIYSGSIFSVH